MDAHEKLTQYHVRLTPQKLAILKSIAKKTDRPVSQLIRDIINQYLASSSN